jgi:hypothetical protein
MKLKEAKAALAKRAPEPGHKNTATGKPSVPKSKRAEPSTEQMNLGERWRHAVREGRVVNATTSSITPNPKTHQVAESPDQPKVTPNINKASPKTPAPKLAAAL